MEFARSPRVRVGFLRVLRFPHHQNTYVGLTPVSTLDQGAGSDLELVPALWLPTAPQRRVKCREHISLYTVHVTNDVPLPLVSEHKRTPRNTL